MASSFVDFINSLPDDKLMALAKPIGSDRARATIVQVVLDKFGVLGWQKLLERLDTTTLQAIGNEVAVEHDDRASLLKTIPKMVSATTHETLASFSTSLVDIMWENLGIIGKPELEILVDELFIGGIESIVGIWTITQMNEIIDTYHISSRSTTPHYSTQPFNGHFKSPNILTAFSLFYRSQTQGRNRFRHC